MTVNGRLTPLMIAHYWRNKIESGYKNIIDEHLTPTVEDYDAIIGMLEEAIDAKEEIHEFS